MAVHVVDSKAGGEGAKIEVENVVKELPLSLSLHHSFLSLSRSLSLALALALAMVVALALAMVLALALAMVLDLVLALSLSRSLTLAHSLALFLTDDRLAQLCLWVGENRFARCQRFRCNLARQVVLPCHSLSLVIPSTVSLIQCNTHTHVHTRKHTSKAIRPGTVHSMVCTSEAKQSRKD